MSPSPASRALLRLQARRWGTAYLSVIREAQTSSNLSSQLKAFGKLELKKRKKKNQVEEGTAEETLTSGSNDPDPTGNNTLQGARERGIVDRKREEEGIQKERETETERNEGKIKHCYQLLYSGQEKNEHEWRE